MKLRICLMVEGKEALEMVDMRWTEGESLPWFHTLPRMFTSFGQMMVFFALKVNPK